MTTSAPQSGLKRKYAISKLDGSPTEPGSDYFVLRLDTIQSDKRHLHACRKAIRAYAVAIQQYNPVLASEILNRYPEVEVKYSQADVDRLMQQVRDEERAKYKTVTQGVKPVQAPNEGIASKIPPAVKPYYQPLRPPVVSHDLQKKLQQDWIDNYQKLYEQRVAEKNRIPNPRPVLEEIAQKHGMKIVQLNDFVNLIKMLTEDQNSQSLGEFEQPTSAGDIIRSKA